MTKRRALIIPLITMMIMMALSSVAHAAGGDFSLNFAAADPGTYNHGTAVGGTWADKVESLEGGDFTCGDKVVYFTEITVSGGASGAQDIELDYGYLAEPTGQPGVGMTDLLSVSGNPGDAAQTANAADTTASIVPGTEHIDTGGSSDELQATVRVNNLDPGEVFILRMVVLLSCIPNSSPTGNLQGEIHDARVVDPAEDTISVGNQTVPFKSVAAVLQAASVSVSVGACPAPGSQTRPVTVTITPSGSSTVTITGPGGPYVVTGSGDTLNLAPGDYSWSAAAEPGYILGGTTSGNFTVATCPKIPASVTVNVGPCPAPGSATRPVTVSISPSGSSTVTITGPGGPYIVTGSGDTLNLVPGDYSWTAVADATHQLDVSAGQFTVASCPTIPASVAIDVGPCPAPGSATRPVTVTIVPPASSTVTITGPGGPYIVTGGGAALNLAPGNYSWTATPDSQHSLEVSSGTFTVGDCPRIPASVSVSVGACPAPGSATRPVTVTIDPPGSSTVVITGPGGPYNVTGSGDTLNLTPGDYSWVATPDGQHSLEVDSGEFTVASCPAIPVTVTVDVGPCPAASSTTEPVTITIDPESGASVEITGPNAYQATVTGSGATLDLAKGTYNWTATAADSTFAISGAASGSFVVADCIIPEVLPRTILPTTGTELPGLGTAGVAFVLVGIAMVSVSRRERRPAVAAGLSALATRMRGRSDWSAPTPRLVLSSTELHRTRRLPLSGWIRRRGDRTGRAGPGDG